jgi:predicted acyl esterase
MRRLVPAVLLLLAAALPSPARAGFSVPPGATWTQGYVTAPDGTRLHYDLLRPSDLPADARTPVILSIGPYFGHAGQTGAAGPAQSTGYDPVGAPGPSDRFADLLAGGQLMRRGYSFVMFDLRGFGASSGCLDWVGPGEQSDVRTAVEWAARQPWSTGRVGMYGKSYDAVTGLVGAVSSPRGLAAVVAQEPVYDLYRYLYADGVRYTNALLTPALYAAIDATGTTLLDDPQAQLANAQGTSCYPSAYLAQQDDEHGSAFWRARDLVRRAGDVRVPLLLTQGFLENNTKPDGAFDLLSAVRGPKRAWLGMWDHVRANDVDADGRLLMGRAGWFDEVMRWFDHYVRGVPLADAPVDRDPPVVVQTSDGSWRGEAAWPPADAREVVAPLRAGSYADDASNAGTAEAGAPGGLLATPGNGLWTISPPLPHPAHLAGVPVLRADVAVGAPRANLAADVYDIDPAGRAILISRGARRVDASGPVTLPLYGDDWMLPAGHRVGVLLTGSNMEWWLHAPTGRPVTVRDASIRLPFLRHRRVSDLPGTPAARLRQFREDAPFTVPAGVLASATSAGFPLPPAQTPRPVAVVRKPTRPKGRRLVARIVRASGGDVIVYGTAPSGWRVHVTVVRGRRVLNRRLTTARLNAFRVRVPLATRGRVRAAVTARKGRATLRARSRLLRVGG